MAFDRLQKLGDEQFGKIMNALQRGEHAKAVARTIQQNPPDGWGLFQDIAETTLMQQLRRLRMAIADGTYGSAKAKELRRIATPNITRLEHITVPVLARAEELSEKQRALVLVLLEKATEEKRTYTSVNEAVGNYRQLLLDIQKLRFDLGLDEWKGPLTTTVRGAMQSVALPDGTSIQKQVFEAVRTVEQIFDRRAIPAPER